MSMNGTNKTILGTMVGVVSVFLFLSLLKTLSVVFNGDGDLHLYIFDVVGLAIALIDPGFTGSYAESLFINAPELAGSLWESYEGLIRSIYVEPFEVITEQLGEELWMTILVTVGAISTLVGMSVGPWGDVSGTEEDPREYLLTHRPKAVLWAAEFPWNILYVCWSRRKATIAIPLLFLPLVAMFAAPLMLVSVVTWFIARAVVGCKIRSAARKERELYDNVGFGVCPECRGRFEHPLAACHRCELVFDYPFPDVHGYKHQYCNNGHMIPCRNEKGARSTLVAVCPRCGQKIKTCEARPHVFSFVGASGSGKTSLMLATAGSMMESSRITGITAETSEGLSADRIAKMTSEGPTEPGARASDCMYLRRRDLRDREIVFNDISGAEFEAVEDRDFFEEYYGYGEGIVFVIDPAEVSAVYLSKSLTKGTKVTPKSTFDTFFQIFSTITGGGPSSVSDIPFAIVLTRAKQPRVVNKIGDMTPEEFLRDNGQEEFVETVDMLFSDVRYFYVDTVDDPDSAVTPFKWMIGNSDPELYSALWPSSEDVSPL